MTITSGPPDVTEPDSPTQLDADGPNAIAITLGLLGDEWNLQILRHTLAGGRRYGDYREALDISHSVLSGRIDLLVRTGMLRAVPYQDRPVRHEYQPTKRGSDTWPILIAMWMWEARWAPERGEPLPSLRHAVCGRITTPVLHCAACDEPATARDVDGGFGPAGSWARSVPAATTRRRSRGSQDTQLPETMELLGNRWSAAIIGAAYQGIHRFKDFESALGAPPTVISDRLRRLTELGVLAQTPSGQRSDWFDYHFTDKGLAFFPVVIGLIDWGERWFTSPEGPSFVYRHRSCGQRFRPWLVCPACGRALHGSEVHVDSPDAADRTA